MGVLTASHTCFTDTDWDSEFGFEHVGKVALIKRALYSGKMSGADFWRHLRSCMEHLNCLGAK